MDRKQFDRLKALAAGGTAGVAAFDDAAAQQKQDQSNAIGQVLASMGTGGFGMSTPGADYTYATTAGKYAAPAWQEAVTAGQNAGQQVSYDKLAIAKLLRDNDEAVADMNREGEIGRDLANRRQSATIDVQRQQDTYAEQVERSRQQAEAAAQAPAAPTFTPIVPAAPTPPKKTWGEILNPWR